MAQSHSFDRQIIVFVKDADGNPLTGSTIHWKEGDKDRGSVENSEGRGTLIPDNASTIVDVIVEYPGQTAQTRKLAIEETSCQFTFSGVHSKPAPKSFAERHFPSLIGIGFVIVSIALAFVFSKPSPLQTHIILAVLSLGGGAFASEIPGMLKVDLSLSAKFTVAATGAAAIFVILYFAVPVGSN
jgi:hypothetical protein